VYGLGDDMPATPGCSPFKKDFHVQLCVRKSGKPGKVVTGPLDVCTFLKSKVGTDADRESFYSILLDTRNRPIGIEEVAKGSLSEVGVHPREVFKSAIVANAASMIIAHNHPSGDAKESQQDVDLTARLVNVANMIGIPIRDHIIMGGSECTSMRERYRDIDFGALPDVPDFRRKK
jgi:DNA repair protein RadC